MQNIKLKFSNAAGESLAALLDMPAGEPRAFALFAHCFTCTKNLRSAVNISRALTESGLAVLRFDFTGLGESDGDFSESRFSTNVEDLVAAARYLESEYRAPAILLGHSLGGTAVLQAASKIASAVAVATIGSPADPAHVTRLFAPARDEIDAKGLAEVDLGGRLFTIHKAFVDDLEKHDLPASIADMRKALLVMHAPLDKTVEIDNASKLFTSARHPKSFLSLDKADHLLSREADSRYAGKVLAAWASRYLPEDADIEAPDVAEGDVVARTPADSFRTELQIGSHRLIADEPGSVGGTDLGPSPYGLLSAALASCTTMTLKMYADQKQLGLDAVTVRVSHRKVHAKDCADCESNAGRIDEFEREVAVTGELGDDQVQRMLEIADKCPVHRTLHGEVKVRTRLGKP